MSYTPPAYTDAGGSLSSGYTPPAYTAAGGDVEPPPPVPPEPPGLPTSRIAPLITVVQLRIGSDTYYFSDGEYGDNATRWHDCRLVGDIGYSRGGECVLHGGQRRGSAGLGNVELINVDGRHDTLATGPQDDAEVRMWRVYQDQPMSSAVAVAAAIVTDIEGRGEETLRIITGDLRSRLDVPLQPELYATGEAVASQVGRPRPVAIGRPKSCPIVLVDEVDYKYDIHDSDAAEVVLVRDSGVVLALDTVDDGATGWPAGDEGDGYIIAAAPIHGIELLQMPVGRVVADIDATTAAAESIIGSAEGDFTTDLTGWSVITETTGGGTATVVQSAGVAQFDAAKDPGGAAIYARLRFPTTLVAGQRYSWSMDVDLTCAHDDSTLELFQVFFEPLSGLAGEYVTLALRWETGTEALSGEFTAPAAGRLVINAGAASVAGVDGEISAAVDDVRLSRIASGGTVADVIEQLLARAGISSDQIDSESIEEIRTARPWPVSYWADGAVAIADVLQQVLDSIYGWHYITPDNRIAFAFLTPPEAADESVLTIAESTLDSGIEVYADLAPGLSTTVSGARNWYRYGPGELADAVTDADRALLTADYRIRCTSTDPVGLDLGRRQGAAVSRQSEAGIATLLDDEADIQAAADYLAELYPADVPRKWYRIPNLLSDASAAALKPGQKITLVRDRYGCDAGRPLRFMNITARDGDGTAVLLAWGSGDA